MIEHKHHGVVKKEELEKSLKKYDFVLNNYSEDELYITAIISKDYSKNFNIEFNGKTKIECLITKKMYDIFCLYTYPTFKEISNIIPKNKFNHINSDGSICYAPPQRPLIEKWDLEDFIKSIDSFFNNYFSIEYIGTGKLIELEHGKKGVIQYELINKLNKENHRC